MKDKLKPLIKEAKKTAQKAIHQQLVASLKDVAAKFSSPSKKLDKKIEKEAKKLAKKMAKNISINKDELLKDSPEPAKPIALPVKPKAAKKTATATSAQ